jgi:viroplasmin and RNaseH domain-containing protein
MQSRTRYLIYSEGYEGYLNRMADGITQSMFKALWFSTDEEAEAWMKGIHAPKDIENYEIQKTVTTMEVVKDGVISS